VLESIADHQRLKSRQNSSTPGEAIIYLAFIYENKFPEIFFTSMKIML
jgi:hypothetical protein